MGGLGLLVEVGYKRLSIFVLGHGVFVIGHGICVGIVLGSFGLFSGQRVKHFLGLIGGKLGLFVNAQDVLDVGDNLGVRILVLRGCFLVSGAAGVEPAVAGNAVVGPVGHHAAADGNRQPVDKEHDDDEDGQAKPTVRHNAVDLLRRGQTRARALDRLVDDVADGVVALGRDDGLGIVVELVLDGFADGRDGVKVSLGKFEVGDGFVLGLEQLDGVPACSGRGHLVAQNAFDLRERFLDGGVELHLRGGNLVALRSVDGGLHDVFHAATLQGRRGDDGAAELFGQAGDVDLVAVFLHQVHHVQRDDNRHAQVHDLAGQVQVALKVRCVDQVDDGIGAALKQVVARHDFLGRIRRQRVDARQVRDGHVLVARVLALFLLDGNARPVANVLVGAGQVVEHRRLAAVRVAGKRNADSHVQPFVYVRPRLFSGVTHYPSVTNITPGQRPF